MTGSAPVGRRQGLRLHGLMSYRVREILLVSSEYDAFILEEDGPLTEQIFETYSEQSLSWAPRITRVSHGPDVLQMIDDRRFDLVIAMPRLEDTNVLTLAGIKERIEDLRARGYDVTSMRVAWHGKFARAVTPLVMVLLGLPFAFLFGRKGSLYGIAVSFVLAIVYWAVQRAFCSSVPSSPI